MIYIDEYIIINTFIDYIILKSCSYILKINTTNKRIIIACLVSNISLILLFININVFMNMFFKLILSILMIYISFGKLDLLKNTIYFYILNFLVGGFLFYFKNEGLLKYKYYLFFIPIFINIFKYFAYNLKKYLKLKYKVTVYLKDGKVLYLNGYMDSANTLVEPYTNKKIIITNKKIDGDYFLVPYKTIDNSSFIRCINPLYVYIDGIGLRRDISIGIINKKFKGYDCLLNYRIMEE